MSQKTHFLQGMFQMTAIALITVINHYHINGVHLLRHPVFMSYTSKVCAFSEGEFYNECDLAYSAY